MKLLVTGAWQGFAACSEQLKKAGHEVQFLQWEKDPLPCDPAWPEGIIGNGIFLSHPIEQFKNLRYIQLTSAGFDRVPMDYVKEHGIGIHNARGVYSIPMAEFALGGVLQLYKQFESFAASQKKHEWNKIRTVQELNGSNVCILGCGSVGTECAKRFSAFGCRVIGIDLYPREDAAYEKMLPLTESQSNAEQAAESTGTSEADRIISNADQAIRQADILVMTVPLTEETRGLLNRERMAAMKQNAVIVNIARGPVMDYKAFIELKQNDRKDLRAVLDVFEEEPLNQESPLWDMEGVIITPHNSFTGNGNQGRLNEVILGNLQDQ